MLKARVRAAPSEGEANAALMRLLAKSLGVAPREVTLVAGATRADQTARRSRAPARRSRRHSRDDRRGGQDVMSAHDHRRQGDRGRAARQGRGRGAAPVGAAWPHARARGGAGRQRSGERGLCRAARPRPRSRPACARSTTACRTSVGQAELLALIEQLNADPAVHGILVQLPLPQQIDAQTGARRDRSGQGRRRLSSGQRRAARDRPAGAGAVHAARLRDAGQDGASVARRPRRGGDRALQHRRQAARAAAARPRTPP